MNGDETIDGPRIALSLVSHTNAGKTTLARTLLGEDVGEVRDEAHVTLEAERYVLVETDAGERLELWDTPGFGDSVRLARRLSAQGNPVGWLLAEVWDRFRDRPLWLAQKAVRNVRDESDVVLYLVNASEDPRDAGYVAPEMQVLGWIGKPVLVLLNQAGPPRPAEAEHAEEQRWREALALCADVKGVLALDAFARCWVQEMVLMRAIDGALPPARRELFAHLASAWQARRVATFEQAMAALAEPIAAAADDRVELPHAGWRDVAQSLGRAVGLKRGEDLAIAPALRALAERLQARIAASTDALIRVHGLDGRGAAEALGVLAQSVITERGASERTAAMFGGVVSGALAGLAADLASAGITLGAGLIAGGVLGALGGAGLARGYNIVRGRRHTVVRWSDEFLDGLVNGALLRYLAVAHFGRGRGEWTRTEQPLFWRPVVARVVAEQKDAFDTLWRVRARLSGADLEHRIAAALRDAGRAVLEDLYPGAWPRG